VGHARAIARLILAVAFFAAGVLHLAAPGGFVAITPTWVPFARHVIAITGICEIAGAVALLSLRLRRIAGIMLAIYAACVFPANIRHAVDGIAIGGVVLGPWYHIPRLLFQPVIIWWALWAGTVIDWPLRPATRPQS